MLSIPGSDRCPQVLLRDPQVERWLVFVEPVQILQTHRLDQVLPLLRQLEHLTQTTDRWGAGFLSYESAAAFDPGLITHTRDEFPLLWFGVFDSVQTRADLPLPTTRALPLDWHPNISPSHYRECLQQIHRYIHQGDTYQVNFSYRNRTRLRVDPEQVFLELMAGDGSPYGAYIHTGEWGICCASPELFFRLQGDLIESRPMKGTAARGLGSKDDHQQMQRLIHSEKEQAENVMITDMVRNDLGRIAITGSVHVPDLLTPERYPTVWQMTSTVRARTQASLAQILAALFPAASITGAPKRRSMEIIHALETSPRHLYTGTIGYIAPQRRAQFNVAIRTLMVDLSTGQAEYGVGGGIVSDSDPDLELQECQIKTRILSPRHHQFQLLETLLWRPHQGYSLLDYHLNRLSQSAAYFSFDLDTTEVIRCLQEKAIGFPPHPHRIRLLITRQGSIDCEAAGLSDPMGFSDLPLARDPVDRGDPFLYHKTTHRQAYDRAMDQAQGHPDVLLFNQLGQITESTIANVAFKINGTLVTPPIACGVLPGTYRSWLLERGEIQEQVISVQEAIECSEIYLFNSVRGMQQVRLLSSG